jgi:hypothetical protein
MYNYARIVAVALLMLPAWSVPGRNRRCPALAKCGSRGPTRWRGATGPPPASRRSSTTDAGARSGRATPVGRLDAIKSATIRTGISCANLKIRILPPPRGYEVWSTCIYPAARENTG